MGAFFRLEVAPSGTRKMYRPSSDGAPYSLVGNRSGQARYANPRHRFHLALGGILQTTDVAAGVRFLVEQDPGADVPELVIEPSSDDWV
jgi:hypothetical protein